MALRYADRQKVLQSLESRNYSNVLTGGTLELATGDTAALTFRPGINVLAGGNGAGKSTVLDSIWRCLAPEGHPDLVEPASAPWLRSLTVAGTSEGHQWQSTIDLSTGSRSGDRPARCSKLDLALRTEMILHQIRTDANVADLIDGLDPLALDGETTKFIAYALRRNYARIDVYEIESFDGSEWAEPWPYFVVHSMGAEYPLERMGRGELCLTYLLWWLKRIEPGTIVLLEEPESHLAHFSQSLLFEVLARKVVDLDLHLVASSHSPGFFSAMPDGCVSLISSLPATVVESNLSCVEVGEHLGVTPEVACIAVLEDFVAATLLNEILRRRPALGMLVSARFLRSGESGVRELVADLGSVDSSGPTIVGVLDGDQRGDVGDALHFLPGTDSPEKTIRQQLDAWRAGTLPAWSPDPSLGAMTLRRVLEQIDGKEQHDWFSELGKRIGGTQRAVALGLSILMTDSEMEAQAEQLLDWLAEKAG